MKRENIYCFITAFVISILLSILTIKFTFLLIHVIILCSFAYFCVLLAIFGSISPFIKNKKSKEHKYRLLATIDTLIVILCFIFSLYGTIQTIKNIAYIIFIFAFILLFPLYSGWIRYEVNKN